MASNVFGTGFMGTPGNAGNISLNQGGSNTPTAPTGTSDWPTSYFNNVTSESNMGNTIDWGSVFASMFGGSTGGNTAGTPNTGDASGGSKTFGPAYDSRGPYMDFPYPGNATGWEDKAPGWGPNAPGWSGMTNPTPHKLENTRVWQMLQWMLQNAPGQTAQISQLQGIVDEYNTYGLPVSFYDVAVNDGSELQILPGEDLRDWLFRYLSKGGGATTFDELSPDQKAWWMSHKTQVEALINAAATAQQQGNAEQSVSANGTTATYTDSSGKKWPSVEAYIGSMTGAAPPVDNSGAFTDESGNQIL